MLQEKMTQTEIDALMKEIQLGEIDDSSITSLSKNIYDPIESKYKFNAVQTSKERCEYANRNGTYEEAWEAQQNLHRAAFANWLFVKGLTKDEYYRLMNREAIKRGINPPFKRFR